MAVPLALIIILLFVGIASALVAEAIDNVFAESRDIASRRADEAAEAGLSIAIAKVQRQGSTQGPLPAETPSSLDENIPQSTLGDPFNELSVSIKFLSDSASLSNCQPGFPVIDKVTRLINVTASYNVGSIVRTRQRNLCFQIVPRAYAMALTVIGSGVPASSPALALKNNARLYLPPYYVNPSAARGGDMYVGGRVAIDTNAGINRRDTNNASVYDSLFLPQGAFSPPQPRPSNAYGGVPFGRMWLAPSRPPIQEMADAATPPPPLAANTILPNDSDGIVNLFTSPTLGSSALAAPSTMPNIFPSALPGSVDTTQIIRVAAQRNTAPNNPAALQQLPNRAYITSISQAQNILNSGSTLYGVIAIDCRSDALAGGNATLTLSRDVVIEDGTLFIQGCDLNQGPYNITIKRRFRPDQPVAGSSLYNNTCTLLSSVDPVPFRFSGSASNPDPTSCLWRYPALIIAPAGPVGRSALVGGNLSATGGKLFVAGDVLIYGNYQNLAASPPAAGDSPSVIKGAMAVNGSLVTNTPLAITWTPFASFAFFDPDSPGRWSVRFRGARLPATPPQLSALNKVVDSSQSKATITWNITGNYDYVECTYNGAPFSPCDQAPNGKAVINYTGNNNTFQVTVYATLMKNNGNGLRFVSVGPQSITIP